MYLLPGTCRQYIATGLNVSVGSSQRCCARAAGPHAIPALVCLPSPHMSADSASPHLLALSASLTCQQQIATGVSMWLAFIVMSLSNEIQDGRCGSSLGMGSSYHAKQNSPWASSAPLAACTSTANLPLKAAYDRCIISHPQSAVTSQPLHSTTLAMQFVCCHHALLPVHISHVLCRQRHHAVMKEQKARQHRREATERIQHAQVFALSDNTTVSAL